MNFCVLVVILLLKKDLENFRLGNHENAREMGLETSAGTRVSLRRDRIRPSPSFEETV